MVSTTWRWNRGLNPSGTGTILSEPGQVPPSVALQRAKTIPTTIDTPAPGIPPAGGALYNVRARIARRIIPQ